MADKMYKCSFVNTKNGTRETKFYNSSKDILLELFKLNRTKGYKVVKEVAENNFDRIIYLGM